MAKLISASAFEKKVFDLEEIHIVLRIPSDAPVSDYPFKTMADDSVSLNEFLKERVSKIVGETIGVEVIDGAMVRPHNNVRLGTIRKSHES